MKFQIMLSLQKRFCLIDSPIPFSLVCNPFGTYDLRNENHEFIGNREDIAGTDICNRPAGAWQFDIYHLLPEKYFKENPAFKVALCYDDSLLGENQCVNVDYSDIDLGEGVAGVNGQDVQDTKTHELLVDINSSLNSLAEGESRCITLEDSADSVFQSLIQILGDKISLDIVGSFRFTFSWNSTDSGAFVMEGKFLFTKNQNNTFQLLPLKINNTYSHITGTSHFDFQTLSYIDFYNNSVWFMQSTNSHSSNYQKANYCNFVGFLKK